MSTWCQMRPVIHLRRCHKYIKQEFIWVLNEINPNFFSGMFLLWLIPFSAIQRHR